MTRTRKELVLETLPDTLMTEEDCETLAAEVSETVDRAEMAAAGARRRGRLSAGLSETYMDMAPDMPRPFGRTDGDQLLRSLGIQTSVQLTRNDTFNLLASLMGCTESQIDALLKNKNVPLAVKTILRRLRDDCAEGDTALVERLWDRLYGKGPLRDDLPGAGLVESRVLPGHPMSREAYAIIVENLK